MDVKTVLYFFYRPTEPLFYPKKLHDDTVIFDIPADFLTDEWKDKPLTILNRFGSTECKRIDLGSYVSEDIYKLDLKEVLTIGRKKPFFQFIPKHLDAAIHLVELFLNKKTLDEFIVFAAYCHDRVNSELYIYALSIALLHREDTQNLALPAYWQTFPEKFINASAMIDARTAAQLYENPSDRRPVEIPVNFTGTDADPEHRLAYWREDIGLAVHHWHWHLLYPIKGPKIVVHKDRRGEIFFYMHRQIMCRYTIERLCHGLDRPDRLLYWNVPLDAYFPKLYKSTSGYNWPGRPAGLIMQDIHRLEDDLYIDVADLERWRTRIFDAIHLGYAIDSMGKKVPLDAENGAHVLGCMVEGSTESINLTYYGNLHSGGHAIISHVHDPRGFYLEHAGVVAEATTAVKDTVFYNWHGFIDDIFYEFKDLLTPYTDKELNFSEIEIVNIGLRNLHGFDNNSEKEKPKLTTFWQKSDLNLSNGLDFSRDESIYVRVTHLNHDEFMYTIEVNNKTESEKHGTVRIFFAPIHAFDGSILKLSDQRKLMIEMDRFIVKLQPGQNKILRKSTESSTTIPFEQSFRDLRKNRPPDNEPDNLDSFNFCGCGWPQHMLLPIGTTSGLPMQLFIMISNYEDDKVEQKEPTTVTCQVGFNVCGLKNQKYPDKRGMGYPFDRLPARGINTLHDFLKPNMKVIDFTIVHFNTVKLFRPLSKKKDSNKVKNN